MMKGQKGYVAWGKRPFFGAFQRICRWNAVHRERGLLAAMTDESLKDLGLSRADFEAEVGRDGWHDPLGK